MNCAHWEERIALYMGGDLAREQSAEVERHLAECAGCQMFAGGIRESLTLLREAHADEPDSAAYAAVRARVLAQLEPRRRWRWFFGLASAAAVAALALTIWLRPAPRTIVSHREAAPRRQVATPALPVVERPAVVPVRHVRHRRKPMPPAVKAVLPATPLVVKMVTDDPDVVIYWITDTRGE